MKFYPETYELKVDYDDINEERRMFLIDGGKLSLSALLLAGFIPMDANANPLLIFRVVGGALIKRLSKTSVKKILKGSVQTVNTVSAIDTLTGGKVSASARDLVISQKEQKVVNTQVQHIENSIPNSIWSQSGKQRINEDSNKFSIIIANNSGREVFNAPNFVAKVKDEHTNNTEVKILVKPVSIKPGITVLETRVANLPKTGLKKIIVKAGNKRKFVNQKIVIATNKEIKEVIRIGKNSGTLLFEQYVGNIKHSHDNIFIRTPKSPNSGSTLIKKYGI